MAKSNEPNGNEIEIVTRDQLRKSFGLQLTKEGEYDAATRNVSRIAILIATGRSNIDVDEWERRWNAWVIKDPNASRAENSAAVKGAKEFFAEQFGIKRPLELTEDKKNATQVNVDKSRWEGNVAAMQTHLELLIGIHRHEGYADAFVFRGDSVKIKRDSKLGSEIWTEYDWANDTNLKDVAPNFEISIVNKPSQVWGADITWSNLRKWVARGIKGEDGEVRNVQGTTPSETVTVTPTLDTKRPVEGLTALAGALSENQVTTTANKLAVARSAIVALTVAFPPYRFASYWDLQDKAMHNLFASFGEKYTAPDRTPPAAIAQAMDAATAKQERALAGKSERTQDKSATVIPHPANPANKRSGNGK